VLIDNQLVGTAAIEKDELVTFFVHSDFQNKGIGTHLLNSIESIALANNISSINCEASLTGVQFYKKRGYRLTGIDKEGRVGKQIGMRKDLV
jgi:GNAT superfamily N-acetyltransferase